MVARAFAADVAAKVNILGDALNYTDGAIRSMGIAEGGQGWNPSFQMGVSDDVSGAWMKFYDNKGADGAVSSVNYRIWFKPVDIFTVTVGQWDTNLNQEHINWSNTATAVDSKGIVFSLNTNGISFDAALLPGWSGSNFNWNRSAGVDGWLVKAKNGKAVLSEMYFKFAFGADFGTISAYANLNAGAADANDFGIGYSGNFGGVSMFVNAVVGMQKSAFGIFRAEAYAEFNAGPANIKAFIAGGYAADSFNNIAGDKDVAKTNGHVEAGKAYVGGLFNVGFPMGPLAGYLKIWSGNFLQSPFAITFKPGFTKNVGSCAIDAAVEVGIKGSAVSVDVPFVFTVAF